MNYEDTIKKYSKNIKLAVSRIKMSKNHSLMFSKKMKMAIKTNFNFTVQNDIKILSISIEIESNEFHNY